MFTKKPKVEERKTVLPSKEQVDAEINALLDQTFTIDGQDVSIRSLLPANAKETGRSYIHDAQDFYYIADDPNYGLFDWPTVSFKFTDERGRDGNVTLHFWRQGDQYILRETSFGSSYTQEVNPTARVDYDQGKIVIEGTTFGTLTMPLSVAFNDLKDMNIALELIRKGQTSVTENELRRMPGAILPSENTVQISRRARNVNSALEFISKDSFHENEIAGLLKRAFDYVCYADRNGVSEVYVGRFNVLQDGDGNAIQLLTTVDTRDHGNPTLRGKLGTHPEGQSLWRVDEVFVKQAVGTKVTNSGIRLGANSQDMEFSLGILQAIMEGNFGPNAGVRFERVPPGLRADA